MKTVGLRLGLLLAAMSLPAADSVKKNIPYYTDAMPQSGDLAYLSERCRLDVYTPSGARNLPVVLWFHGGGLSEGEKFIPETLKDGSVVVAAANYRLSGARAKAPDYLEDAAAAAKFLRDHAAEYGGDPANIYISGGSAGGWLALMLAMDPRCLGKFGLSPEQFRFMPISTATADGVGVMLERANSAALNPQMHPTVSEYAPLFHVRGGAPQIDLYVGDPELDWPGRAEENMLFVRLMKRMGQNRNITLTVLPGFDHSDVYAPAMLLMLKKIHAETLAGRAGRLPPPPRIGNNPALRRLLVGRFGEAAERETGFRLGLRDGKLICEVDCAGSDAGLVAEARQDGEKYVYQGDCVEFFLSPDPRRPGETLQVIADPNGRKCVIALGGLKPPPAGAVQVESVREKELWRTRITLDASALEIDGRELLFNLYRQQPLARDGRPLHYNFSPTALERNYYPERFAILDPAKADGQP
ncbi:MAG: carboxylesterase family protein [Lentisphaeria bacterium]|nr:carboxylesterase family protein [Lentisphaeria bacterium]